MNKITFNRIIRRKRRISKNIVGTKEKPRISVYRSNRYLYAQAIDDLARSTIVSISSLNLKKEKGYIKKKKIDEARQLGTLFVKALKGKKIEIGIFDRAIYSYKGRVKAFAEGLREGGLKI